MPQPLPRPRRSCSSIAGRDSSSPAPCTFATTDTEQARHAVEIAQLLYTFWNTGDGVCGAGQTIDFDAIDIQHIGDGAKITDDWHLEDNLTLLQQAALVTITGA